MKNEFLGFYEPTKKEIDKSWEEGIFVFDTNALLNLYRYSQSTRNDFLQVLNKVKDRIFLPYQVGHEYHSNRLLVIEALNNSYNSLLSGIKDQIEKNITAHINQFKKHPSIKIENINNILNEFEKKLSAELEKQKNNHPDFLNDDKILTTLTDIFKDKVGRQFTRNELKEIYQEGKERYENLVPPGYKDYESKKKKGEQSIFGDLIIWKEIINYSKENKSKIILVTDDRKEDWWKIENGKTIRPREELIKEFYDITNTRILIYNTDSFLLHAKERRLVAQIKDKTINEVLEIRKTDENIFGKDLYERIKAFNYKSNNQNWLNDIRFNFFNRENVVNPTLNDKIDFPISNYPSVISSIVYGNGNKNYTNSEASNLEPLTQKDSEDNPIKETSDKNTAVFDDTAKNEKSPIFKSKKIRKRRINKK